jgi:predicted NBD/HSP70 family sugar kinase
VSVTTASTPQPLPGVGDLFQLLRDGQARTRAELSQLSALGRAPVAARVDAMLAVGLLRPAGERVSTGGRPPTRFRLDPTARIVLAVDLGASHATVGLVDLSGSVLVHRTEPCDIADGPVAVLDHVAALGQELLEAQGRAVADVAGVGIGLPGPVEHATGRPANPPIMPGWHDFDVPAHLGRTFTGPVLVDNDVNLMALGEHVRGSAGPHLLLVKVATGIGAGIVSDGRLLRGALGSAGDLGHVRVSGAPDARCRCGNVGCLEAVAAGPAVAARLREEGLDVSSAQDVVDAVARGEVAALNAIRDAGRSLGEVLATCVNLLNPSVIVVSGTIASAGEYLLAGVREVVYERSLPLATADLRIVATGVGDLGGLLGAGAMVVDEVLSPAAVDAYVAQGATQRTA